MINEFPLANSYYICDYQINELYSLFLKKGLGLQYEMVAQLYIGVEICNGFF